MIIRRYFHPIGQGAFYQEVFSYKSGEKRRFNTMFPYPTIHNQSKNKFCAIYDCGSDNKQQLLQEIQSIDVKEIDLLFISHFDSDHVNGISELSKKAKIKNVVLPHLTEEIKAYYLLEVIEKGQESEDLFRLIINPSEYLRGLGVESFIYIRNENEEEDEGKVDEYSDERGDNSYDESDIPFGSEVINVESFVAGDNMRSSRSPITFF